MEYVGWAQPDGGKGATSTRRFGTKTLRPEFKRVCADWKRLLGRLLFVNGSSAVYTRPAWHYETEMLDATRGDYASPDHIEKAPKR